MLNNNFSNNNYNKIETQSRISLVVVTWNTKNLLEKCLNSIERSADIPYELFVIDNCSIDDTPNFLQGYKPQNINCINFEYILNKGPFIGQGLSKAANKGFIKSCGEYILLLNPDTEMAPQTLSKLYKIAQQHPNMGAMGVNILNPDGTNQHTVSNFPTIFNILGGRLKLKKLFPNNKFIKTKLEVSFDKEKESVVDQVKGALFFIKKKCFDEIGFFDDKYFLWFEETDFCKRLKNAGYDVMYAPQISIVHQGGAATAKMTFWSRQIIYNKSIRRYFKKHYSPIHSILIGILDPLSTLFSILFLKKK